MVLAVLCVLPVMLVNSKPLRVRALVTLVTLEHTPVVVLNPVHNATVVPTAKLVPYNASHAQLVSMLPLVPMNAMSVNQDPSRLQVPTHVNLVQQVNTRVMLAPQHVWSVPLGISLPVPARVAVPLVKRGLIPVVPQTATNVQQVNMRIL